MEPSVLALIHAAITEDVGTGDVTSLYFIPENSRSRAEIVAREPGIVSGAEIAVTVFKEIDPALEVEVCIPDGSHFVQGSILMKAAGSTRSLLTAERTALNFLQRLCGVATQTQRYVEAVKPHSVQVWDTRKTTPGWRLIEKAAVKHGGGTNHRMGLYDHAMVKDNHLTANSDLPSLQAAIHKLRTERPGTRIQLEADTLDQVAGFLTLEGVDMLLLDNMGPEKLREAVKLVNGKLWLEASGGITIETIKDVAATGVNAISVGALTHSSRALDLGLDLS
ncbi:MAG: carboxylating nicotinate-nucleotide diphosphorylase [Prosthecobacter sp.]|uniref:carboxylating nicotinate-nucleotide diphosphorylase n=1 Tax=Prosthecobacter sp. TaxID=1965333 RepID=UPI00262C8685|nr:carboxylating nicotinate-nucleotide diphosphorylase [Prosthecobacter sp.]MCF7790196.1 carboxylating nicotinate-nucleotide diphosphorylase [Prosthecobacter sp.]